MVEGGVPFPMISAGRATPAGWEPGLPTLKPGRGLVGQVWKVGKPGMET